MNDNNFLTAPNWPQPLGMPPWIAQAHPVSERFFSPDRPFFRWPTSAHRPNGRFGHETRYAARWNELISPDPCPYIEAIVPNCVLGNSSPPYTAPIAVYVAQRHQMAPAVHARNRAQMRPPGEIARMAHPTQPMATDRVRGRSRTRISPHPSYSGYIGGSTEFHGLQEAKIGHFGGFRRSGNRFEMR